jgi:amino acid adenylation domain-containing protein
MMSNGRAQFECVLSADVYPYLAQYEVDGRRALPAAALIELAVAAAGSILSRSHGFELRDVRIAEPVELDVDDLQLTCALEHSAWPGTFRIQMPASSGQVLLAEGGLASHTTASDSPWAADAWPTGASVRQCPAALESISLGAAYGSAFKRLATSGERALAETDPDSAARFAAEGYVVHPVLWQSAIEVARTLLQAAGHGCSGTLIAGKISLFAAARPIAQIQVRRVADRAFVQLLDAAQSVVAALSDLQFLPASDTRTAPAYAVHFREAAALEATTRGPGGWLVVGDSALAPALHDTLLRLGRHSWQMSDERFGAAGGLDANDSGSAAARFMRARGIEHIVYACDDLAGHAARLAQPLSAALASVTRWASVAGSSGVRLWILTQGAHALTALEDDRPQQAALWSFGVALALEVPKAWGGLIDLSAAPTAIELERSVLEIEAGGEDQIALRGASRFARRLVPCPRLRPRPRNQELECGLSLKADASYLVTGGLGGLGLEVARRLAERGARTVVLLGRSRERGAVDPTVAGKLLAIEACGARLIVCKADVADLDAMANLAGRFGSELPRLAGIVHAAGVVQLSAAIDTQDQDSVRVMRPKIDGTLVLERLFPPATLDFFVCFSSGASIWGSRGLAAYAAGSGFMDAWARSHARRGAHTLSVNWGMWARVGMSSDDERASLLSAIGLRAMEPELALDAMEQALAERAAQRVIADIDWSIFRRLYEAKAPRRLLLCEVDGVPAAASNASAAARPNATPPSARSLADTRVRVRALLAELTGLANDSIDSDAALTTLGIDSISGLDLQARLTHEFGCQLPVSEIVQGASVDEIVDRVWSLIASAPPHTKSGERPRAIEILPRGTAAQPSMSLQQERLWFLEQLDPGAAIYNVPGAIHVRGELEQARLRQAFQIVLERHAVLRTSFDVVDGVPAPVLHDQVELPYAFRNLEARRADWPVLARQEVRRPFHLSTAPLLRLLVLRLARDEHVVVMTMHHIVSDAWSLAVLVDELVAIHASLNAGVPSTLTPLPIQFADYAAWQRARVAQGDFDAGVAYWVAQLQHAPRLLELPSDRARPAVRTGRGALVPLVLSHEVSEALRSCAKQHAVTPFAMCLAMWATLLHKYSRQPTVCVGVPVAGRQQLETRSLIGFFVNTIVLRTDFAGDHADHAADNVRTLLARVMAATAQGLVHGDVPFERVVAALQPPRSASHSPLFQAGLAFQNVPRTALQIPGFELQMLDLDPGVSKFDLHLTVLEKDGVYECTLEYSTDLFEQATAERMLRHWSGLIAQAARDPELRIDQLALVDSQERELVLRTWNQTTLDFEAEPCLHRLIEAQAARSPERTAIVFESTSLTYADLDLRANRLAWRLRSAGIGSGDFVGVFMDRSVELVVALLAILKSGAAYVPFDPSYPHARLEFLVRDAGARLVFTHEPLFTRAAAAFERIWLVDLDELASGSAAERLPDSATGDSPAYMLYTSGSTGTPKGALNSHRAICNRLLWMQAELKLDASDVVLQKTPIGFDVSVWELFWPLIAGARELLAEPGGHRDAGYLAQLIAGHGVTTVHFVPSMLQTFFEEKDLERLVSLRRIVCSGEVLSRDLHDRALRAWPEAALYNLYGPTEAAVDVSVWKCSANDKRRAVPIGRPIANTQLYVLDAGMNPLPVGVPGELYIAGVQVGLGYHRQPALTRERFLPDPFAVELGARMYRTGDLARWHGDGTLEYVGRIDQQIKLHGCRIEPGEIESVLLKQPAVAEAAVVVRSTAQDAQLVAYVVPARDDLSSSSLLLALRAELPEFMLPSCVVTLPALPRSPNGKLDRQALPAPEPKPRAVTQRACNETEWAVLAMWRELLGRDDIGVDDNFFEVGGHSLLAARLAARMSQRFGTRISVAALLAAPTIEQMARLIRHAGHAGHGVDDVIVEFGPAVATPSLFLVHPAGGDASCYRHVAHQLRSRVRVLGIRSPALTGGTLHDDVPNIAREYLRAVRRSQPKGPYSLGGWSMGGVVAFEMAKQLLESGEQVNALVVIDSFLPSASTQALLHEPSHTRAFARDFAAMFGFDEPRIETGADDRESMLDELHAVYVLALADAAPTRAEIARRMQVYCAHCDAMMAYRPKALPVRLALVLSEEGSNAEPLFGSWESLGQCESKLVVRGGHFSLMNGPNLSGVTKVIQRILQVPPDSSTVAN